MDKQPNRRFRFRLRTLLIATALTGALMTALMAAMPWLFPEYRAYFDGAAEARRQIRDGHLTLYTYGQRDVDRSYDADAGLPLEAIAGCVIDNRIAGRARGHDDTVRAWIARGNTPLNSLKPYNALIANPFAQVALADLAPIAPDKPLHLPPYRIRYAAETYESPQVGHLFEVHSTSVDWNHLVYISDAREFKIGLLADGRILALRYIVDGKDSAAGKLFESIQLFDAVSGISLNYADRQIASVRATSKSPAELQDGAEVREARRPGGGV